MPHKVVIRAAGGLEQIGWEAGPAPVPQRGEVLIRVEAAGAAFGDVLLRRGVAGGRFPVTPGYDLVGIVERLGPGAARFKVGDRVAGLPGRGAQQELICLLEAGLLAVPPSVTAEKAAATILNYLTAYQLLTRAAPLKPGQSAFVYGLAGGLGSAMRQVAAQLGLSLYGTASPSRLKEASEGATAFDRSDSEWPQAARRECPEGFDAVFDPLGGASLNRSYELLSRSGSLVVIGAASSIQGTSAPRLGVVGTLARFAWLKAYPDARHLQIFLVQGAKRSPERFQRELETLFQWLAAGNIDPRIHAALPLRDARAAQDMLERGEVSGKIILKP